MGITRITLLLTLGFAAGAESADNPKPKAEAGTTVTVTAEAASVEVAKTPNPVRILGLERIQASGATLATELIADLLPGQVASYGGVGTQAALFLGGARSQDVVVLLDGLRINEANLGVDLSLFGLEGVERAEVMVGPASTRYGAEAHGGVLALYSAGAPLEGFHGRIEGGLGTQGIQRGRFSPSYSWQRGWVRASAGADRQDQPTATEASFRQVGSFVGLGQQIGEGSLLQMNYRNTYSATPIPYYWAFDWNTFASTRAYAPAREARARHELASLNLRTEWSPRLFTEFVVGQVEVARGMVADPFPYEPKSRRTQAGATATWTAPRWTASFLADAYDESSWTTDPDRKAYARHVAGALEASAEPLNTLRLVGSLRHQRDRIGQENTPVGQETAIGQTTWKLGANLLLPGGWRAYVNTGTSFNTPSLYAIGANQISGRPEPGNEKSRSILAGFEWRQGGWNLRLEANRLAYDALLQYVPTGMFTGYFENRKDVRVQGLEASAGWTAATWGLEGFLRSQEGRDLTLPEAQQRTVFLNRPFFSAGLRAQVAFGDFRFSARAAFLGHRYVYSDDFGGTTPERTHFVDLALVGEYRVTKELDLVLRADHLLQDPLTRADWEAGRDLGRNNVAVLPGYPSQTRTLSLEARYRF